MQLRALTKLQRTLFVGVGLGNLSEVAGDSHDPTVGEVTLVVQGQQAVGRVERHGDAVVSVFQVGDQRDSEEAASVVLNDFGVEYPAGQGNGVELSVGFVASHNLLDYMEHKKSRRRLLRPGLPVIKACPQTFDHYPYVFE